MEALEYLRILRRRWYYLVVGVVAGVVAGFVSAPGTDDGQVRYEGVHTLVVDPNSGSGVNLEQAALFITVGVVPERVAERFGGELPGTLSATANDQVSSLRVRGEALTPEVAAQLADAAAEELQAELVSDAASSRDTSLAQAETEVTAFQLRLDTIAFQLAPLAEEDPARAALEAERSTVTQRYQEALNNLQSLQQQPAPIPPLRTLEQATGRPVRTEGLRLPGSPPVRGALLGIFGLAFGAVGAVLSQRLDTRIRTKEDAEDAYGFPVLAEIPPFNSRRAGRKELLAVTQPAAPSVEAYRGLRTVLQILAVDDAEAGKHSGAVHHADHEAKVVLVVSPGASEGKTTTVANLAALLAEVDKSVLVVSADFRRPRIHELFDLSRDPGLTDILGPEADDSLRLGDLKLRTSVDGVRLLPSGTPVSNPAPFLPETAQLIAAARRLFDYVLIDTAPLLVANDAAELAGVADMVVLVARADRTHRVAARRAAELLARLDAPVVGAIVVAANDTPSAYAYYRYRYYAESDQPRRRKPVESRPADAVVDAPSGG